MQSSARVTLTRRWFGMVALACGLTTVGNAAEPTKPITISSPWTLATPDSAKVAGGFLTITNTGKTADRLIRAETDVSGAVEIHEMQMVNGIMMMRVRNPGITVKAGRTVVLKPFSHHLMLMDIKRTLKTGETVKGTLVFEKAGPIKVIFPVEPLGSNGPKPAAAAKK
jgi:copper(I)-binding protein